MLARFLSLFMGLALLVSAGPALAAVTVSFHSFNGSVLGSRFPHTFVVLEGTLNATGQAVSENYGFSAASVGPAVLNGPVKHVVMTEPAKYIKTTNRHFTVTVSDATYHRIVAEVARWRDAPGKYYELDTRNCIHFVGAIAELAGIKVTYPKKLVRRPKAWLNHVARENPQLGAKEIK